MSKEHENKPEEQQVVIKNTTNVDFMTFNMLVRYPETLNREDFANYNYKDWESILTSFKTLRKAKYVKWNDNKYISLLTHALNAVQFEDPKFEGDELQTIRALLSNKPIIKFMIEKNYPFTFKAAIVNASSGKKLKKLTELLVW